MCKTRGINKEEQNGQWKGDNVGYIALHAWVKRRLVNPEVCERCNKKDKKLDLANISNKYLRRLDDWEWLCRKCHMEKDGRMFNLTQNSHYKKKRICIICGQQIERQKYCVDCAKEKRKQWWKEYNQTEKRAKYRIKWNQINNAKPIAEIAVNLS